MVGPPLELVASTAADTRSVGDAIGATLKPGDVVSLCGDLGAGKTTLVQGAARRLGVREPVLSPTFTLVREYRGEITVFHLDVYRLDRLQEVLDLGFDEMLRSGGVMFIEWGDVIEVLLPPSWLEVELTILPQDGEREPRRITVRGRGPSWSERLERLAVPTERWRI